MKTDLKTITIIVPELFYLLPKAVKDIVYEYNVDHRSQMKEVLNLSLIHI